MRRNCVASRRSLALIAVCLGGGVTAQVPNPDRTVHPAIAPPAPELVVPSAPLVAAPDGVWNHGEGFGDTPIDRGGWHGPTDGTDVRLADVHVEPSDIWVPFTPPGSTTAMLRMEGWLAPPSYVNPDVHPLYGPLGRQYVDQGAFELFKPTSAWNPATQQILIVVHTKETSRFPEDRFDRRPEWRQMYRGFFSADGLVRREPAGGHDANSFNATDQLDGSEVERPLLHTLARWDAARNYWPIEAYAVTTVMHRSTTLNEQRDLQVLQAVKALLMDAGSARNPVGAANALTPQQLEARVVVVFTGGSNGGMQSSLATLRYPHLVHGCYAAVINPSYQRLYGQFDFEHALSRITGVAMGGNVMEDDLMTWNQYVWAQGLEMHDMSYLRLFAAGASYRPTCFMVGDEDITSTGVDWVRVIDGAAWRPSGLVHSSSAFGSPLSHTFAWATGENVCHQGNIAPFAHPYTGAADQWYSMDVLMDLHQQAIQQRAAQLAANQQPPIPALTHVPRQPAQQRFGLDDPQEWWLSRPGDALPTPSMNDPLRLDGAFASAVNPGATGNYPGGKEAMFVRDGRVYVGSVDGFVTSFDVDVANAKKPLRRLAQSPKLGHECFAIGAVLNGGDWWLVAGTRRHLHRLDRTTLQRLASVELPYEVAQPHHITCADVLPGHAGSEIVFASVHGGLCFYDLALQPIFEWPEPGIVDFFVHQGQVTFQSARGVIAAVSFSGPTHAATLQKVSRAIPMRLTAHGHNDPPCQGVGSDLELMRVNWAGAGLGLNLATISVWHGDEDSAAVRGHWLGNLQAQPYLAGLGEVVDVATCTESNPGPGTVGDHALVLQQGRLRLYDQYAQLVGEKALTTWESTAPPAFGFYPFGAQAHHLAVGELVANAGAYGEEVVIATKTGLMWMHIDEVAGAGTNLPATGTAQGGHASGFWMETERTMAAPAVNSQVQARTNQVLSSTWAMARRPGGSGLDNDLHVLDQRGVYWKVGHGGQVRMWESSAVSQFARGWDYVGPVSVPPNDLMTFNRQVTNLGALVGITTRPFCPKNSVDVVFEAGGGQFVANNWQVRPLDTYMLDGFVVHDVGGGVVQKPNGPSWGTGSGYEIWRWSHAASAVVGGASMGDWGNLVQGFYMQAGGAIDGVWASTHVPDAATRCPHHRLRSYAGTVATMTQQAVCAVELQIGAYQKQTAVVLGCPGGRVRVLLPGEMRRTDVTPHALGEVKSSADLGFGGAALAVRHELQAGSERLRIWFGTMAHPDRRPAGYSNPLAALQAAEVAAGGVHTMTFTPGQGFSAVSTVMMHPATHAQRGASGVAGLLIANLLPAPGDELVVGTVSGDLVVFAADSMAELWRSHVHGGIGCYNSLRAEDLDGDGLRELYVAGSYGLWRFVQPGE
jgi:hypothetical protein